MFYLYKVIYEGIFSAPIIQNAYKSYRVSFGGGGSRNAQSLLWGLSLGVGFVKGNNTYSLYSIKTITPMESPRKP